MYLIQNLSIIVPLPVLIKQMKNKDKADREEVDGSGLVTQLVGGRRRRRRRRKGFFGGFSR